MTDPAPEQPTQTPQVQPPTQTQPVQQQDNSAAYWQSQYDKQQQATQQMQQQMQQLQQQVQQISKPSSQQETPQKLDYNNWKSWKGEDGSYKQEYVNSVFHPDLPEDVRNTLLNTIDGVNTFTQQQMQQHVTEKFGSKDNLDAALAWAQSNIPEYERNALNAALQNPALAPMALQSLRDKAEAGGAFEQRPQQGDNEPAPIPAADGSPRIQLTPLVPGSEEARAACADPRYKSDKVYQQQVAQRLQEGSKQLPNITRML